MLATSHWLRGGQLSPHFSFVDNPLAFLPTAQARLLSALHVHVIYARLLLWPASLSADYSFDCVPAVHALLDRRNLSAAALYIALAWAAADEPLEVLVPDGDAVLRRQLLTHGVGLVRVRVRVRVGVGVRVRVRRRARSRASRG